MAKRGYKFQEFIAHSSNVRSIKIGTKSCGIFVSGGEDRKVNLWAIGKSNGLLSLSGHTSPVESVTFDSAEVLVVSGASNGAIKLWDLEEAKIVRTITGHRTNCTSVEFHPFGEFFASGSLDTNLKIWDIRRKGCIHTYKGHSRKITTIKFTPDGRWVVTGGEDNVVKLWDLTAGKLLHDFKFHGGQIRCIDFHPHEFLLATGSADRTVKFWDLETFELIGSAGPEATGVRSIAFHPDGRTLFCGLDESLKVFSWEPIRCHDAVDMGWSTLCDLNFYEGKLVGCSYHQNSIVVWFAETSLIGPYAVVGSNGKLELEYNIGQKQSMQQVGSSMNSSTTFLTTAQDYESKHSMRRLSGKSSESCNGAPQVFNDSKDARLPSKTSSFGGSKSSTPNKSSMMEVQTGLNNQVISRHVALPVIVPRISSNIENAANSRKGIASAETIPPVVVCSKPNNMQNLTSIDDDVEKQLKPNESRQLSSKKNGLDRVEDQNFASGLVAEDRDAESGVNIRVVAEKFERILSPDPPLNSSHGDDADSLDSCRGINSVKCVKVEPGRTRSLVERWERRERCTDTEAPKIIDSSKMPEALTSPPKMKGPNGSSERDLSAANDEDVTENLMQNHESFLSVLQSRLTKLQVVRHFWERNDIKGAINAVERLPDHSVQSDVISILMERIEVVTLNLFSCLLPLLTGLIDSNVDRQRSISLEMLLKLVKIFGPVIHSTVSSTSPVGIDLQAEQRHDCCTRCFLQLQKIKQVLPPLIRRGGMLAKSAMELNLAIQEL